MNQDNWRRCLACALDPDPRGPSACFDCRELNRARPPLDLSAAHVDRVARRLFRAFDDVNNGHEPLHDFDVLIECEHEGLPVITKWRALALAAIQLGAVAPEDNL